MIQDLLENPEFQKLEKEYKFLSRAREKLTELESLPYVFIDIETTGLNPEKHAITEIAALKIENKEITDVFNTLIKPKHEIPYQITQLTGITNEMVEDQPSLLDILPKFLKFINGFTLVAHNTDFDIAFLKHHLQINKKELKNNVLCSLKLSRALIPNLSGYKLKSVAEHFGIKTKNLHRALGDVEALYQIWFKLLPIAKKSNIYDLLGLLKIC